jgi:hypothetical protein
MISTSLFAPRRAGRRLAYAGFACAALLLMAGCGSGDDGATPSAQPPAQSNNAPIGAGGVAGEVPIVAAPAQGPCAAAGTPAIQSPLLNSQIDCAP